MVRVRIAPSPTGFPHVGTAYTALFNYAFAKKNTGQFIIRLEDTDVKRHVVQAEKAIYEGLRWLGLTWDEGPDKGGSFGPYRQSERLNLYQGKARELITKGLAYEKEGAVYCKSLDKDISWIDLVRGSVTFPQNAEQLKDFVILKSDGYPTYNFAVVIDDSLMQISHVIRAEEHISNTPRQLVLYEVLGQNAPQFAHLPALRNINRVKLSKRRDPVDLRIYRDQGYLPEALVNFLCLLGWSHPEDKELFSLEEFVRVFDMNRVRRAGPVFDVAKLQWINGEYIRQSQNAKLKTQILEYLGGDYQEDVIEKTIPLVKDRIKTLGEYKTLAGFFFGEPTVNVELLSRQAKEHLEVALEVVGQVEYDKETLQKAFLEKIEQHNFKTGDFFMSLRVALTGSKVTPPIIDSMVLLGKEKAVKRIERASQLIANN